MPITGTRRAALLLKTLDPQTAGELLKGAPSSVVTEIAAELALLDAPGTQRGHADRDTVNEFASLIRGAAGAQGAGAFVERMLDSAVGREQSRQVLGRVRSLLEERDPFLAVRSADVARLARALAGESGRVAALVLMELPAEKSSALLPLLDESIRSQAVWGMMTEGEAATETRSRVAAIVRRRLEELGTADDAGPGKERRSKQLRKVALLLRGLETSARDGLLEAMSEQDADTAGTVRNLMVVWEDIPAIRDRSLQEVLRSINSKSLALALVGADSEVVSKIRTNISARAGAMLDEEATLLSEPKDEDVQAAREEVLAGLRELNQKGELRFVTE